MSSRVLTALRQPVELGALRRSLTRPIEYDAVRRRLWILGQRCHHGATGSVLAAAGLLELTARRDRRAAAALASAGGLLMAHDWKDRTLWFEPGHGRQP